MVLSPRTVEGGTIGSSNPIQLNFDNVVSESAQLVIEKWGAHDAAEDGDAIANDEYYFR